MRETGKLVVVSGPSGVGKSVVSRAVLDRTGARYSVSVTTRRPRQDEENGRDYRFVDREKFEKMITEGAFLEWAEVFDQYYGTPADAIRDAIAAGETILLEIDVQGALQVHDKMPDATFVLIVPPNEAELARRLRGRASETDAELAKRLGKAASEIDLARQSGIYAHQIVNDDLDETIDNVMTIVQD